MLALIKTSSAYDSPAASIATMVNAVVFNRRRFLPFHSYSQQLIRRESYPHGRTGYTRWVGH